MEVKCPNCTSRFNLPDGVAKPGAKLRCSVCKEIFRLPTAGSGTSSGAGGGAGDFDLDKAPLSMQQPSKSRVKRMLLMGLVVLLLAGGGAGGWWFYAGSKADKPVTAPVDVAKLVELLTMRNVRQYYVNNEKIGPICVIEGKVVNEFPVTKELIEVEAAIYGKDKTTLASKTQLAGTALSLFQLQVLGEKELESFLSNKIEILTNNTNITTGGEVPFMVLFYKPPPDVAEFGVKIVNVRDVEKK